MSDPVFYKNAVALDRQSHKSLKIAIQDDHYAFAGQTNALPVAASEFAEAGRHYPIVFVEGEDEQLHAAALLGLRDQANLFVDGQGRWERDTYVPAFARRYPFVLGSTQEDDRLAVCLDESYAGFNEQEGVALFEEDQESDYLKQMMEFLQSFQREMDMTGKAVERLKALGLLAPKSITITQDGKDQYLTGFWVVDEEKFNGLDHERIVELFQSGLLRMLELHRASLGNVQRLAGRLDRDQKDHASASSQEAAPTQDSKQAAES